MDVKLEFRLLGDIAVLADGQPLDLGGTRERSVLALLVLQRNRSVPTELLADRLWPDDQPLTAIKTIQVYVSRLRHALGPAAERLTSSPTGYRLEVGDDELDAARFERGLRQAREALAPGSPDAALSGLEEILALWSGPALGDLAAERFARREADRLEELRLQALEELFELRIAAGSGRSTIGELRRLTAERPGRERLWRLLMLALYADGRQAEALQAYRDAHRYLADELGLDPGQELQDLERAILTHEAPRPRLSLTAAGLAGPAGDAMAQPNLASAGVEPVGQRTRRVVTVLRADGVRTSEALDPEVLEARARRTKEIVRRAVERHGGTVDYADGQGVTAIFGLTVTREDDALRAVRAASELRDDPASVDSGQVVAFRIGVATGEVVAGPRDVRGSTITGAPLQMAAQLAARATPGEVLLASETEQLAGGTTVTEALPLDEGGDAPIQLAVRLLAITEGEPIARRAATPFIDRVAEVKALLAAFERVVSGGTPGLATVIGAPGVGKSRLVAESLARLSGRARILRSRCLPYGDGITYWPVRELVLAAADIGQGEPRADALARLGAIVAGLDRADIVRRGLAAVVGLAEEDAPAEEIRWAVRRFFEALAAERPLVLLVDDLHWAEPALVGLLAHVLDLGRRPILLVTIARPELEDTHPDWLARPSLSLIRLDSLSEADAGRLLDRLVPELSPVELRSRILAIAEGNPLFVEQFVAYVSDEAHTAERSLDVRTQGHLPIPPTIGILLAARLDRLPDIDRRILARAAVIGRTFWAGALAELLPPDERSDLSRPLARLARRDLIRPDRSDVPDDEAYRFRHLLIRDAAYAALPKRERADSHERFAGWLEHRSMASPGEYDLIVGYHLEQACRYRVELGDERTDVRLLADRALAIIGPAGQAAWERGDPHAAVSLLRRAVDLSAPGPWRIELLLDLGSALRVLGDRDAADAVDAEVRTLLAEYPDRGLELRRRLLDVGYVVPVSIQETGDAYAYYEQAGDRLGMIRALDVAHFSHSIHGKLTAAMEALERATDLALEIGRHGLAAELGAAASVIQVANPVPVPEALDRCRRYLDLAGDNRRVRAHVLCAIGLLEAMDGADDGWRGAFDEAKAILDDLGLRLGVANYAIWLGEAELAAGEPGRVVELLRWSCSTLGRLVAPGEPPSPSRWSAELSSTAPLTALALLAVGQLEDVERYAFWGRDLANPADHDARSRWRIAISGLRSRQGHHDEAVALAREAVALLAGTEAVVLLAQANHALAGALRAAGDEPAALGAAQEAWRLASAKQDRSALRKIEAFLDG